jgi:hypothetical protein
MEDSQPTKNAQVLKEFKIKKLIFYFSYILNTQLVYKQIEKKTGTNNLLQGLGFFYVEKASTCK